MTAAAPAKRRRRPSLARLRRFREIADEASGGAWSQTALARELGCAQAFVSQVESGVRGVSVEIADAWLRWAEREARRLGIAADLVPDLSDLAAGAREAADRESSA